MQPEQLPQRDQKRKSQDVQMLSPTEMEAIWKEVEAAGGERPEQQKRRKETPEERAREKTMQDLRSELEDVKLSIQGASGELRRMQRKPLDYTIYPGMEVPTFDKEAIEAAEDELLKHTAKRESLNKALQAFELGRTIPPESRAALRAIQIEAAEELGEMFDRKEKDPQFESGHAKAQDRLQKITDLMEQLGV